MHAQQGVLEENKTIDMRVYFACLCRWQTFWFFQRGNGQMVLNFRVAMYIMLNLLCNISLRIIWPIQIFLRHNCFRNYEVLNTYVKTLKSYFLFILCAYLKDNIYVSLDVYIFRHYVSNNTRKCYLTLQQYLTTSLWWLRNFQHDIFP
jgi:hypothetical protein